MAEPHVGVDQRAAWLLACNRMHSEFADRARFIEALRDRKVAVDTSRISRWESGTATVPRQVVAAYEDVLGLGHGRLVAVIDGVRRKLAESPVREPAPTDRTPDLEELIDVCLQGRPSGSQWQQLAFWLTRYEQIYLRPSEWVRLCRRLVAELGRAVGDAYVRRYEAAGALIRHPSGQRHISRAIGVFVTHPDTQVVMPVLRLLTEVDDEGAADLVLRMLNTPARALRRAASSVAAVKLRLGHFRDEAMPMLERHAARSMRHSEALDGGLDAFDLTVQLPPRSFARVLHDIGDLRVRTQLERARRTGELLPGSRVNRIAAQIASAAQAETHGHATPEPDQMLRRLVREALFHSHKGRRHHAALLLAASPYRDAVAHQCHLLTGGADYFHAARAWALLMRVGLAGRRADVVLRALSEVRPTLKSRALVNLGLNAEPLHPSEARALTAQLTEDARTSEVYGTLFALGMSGSEEISTLADSDHGRVRRIAKWWLAGVGHPRAASRDGLSQERGTRASCRDCATSRPAESHTSQSSSNMPPARFLVACRTCSHPGAGAART